jgi:transcription antitermination protein NusB
MGQRRRARECALQILFQLEFNPAEPQDLIRVYWEHQKTSKDVREYGTWIVATIRDHGEAIDGAIQAASKNWRLARMAVVDRNILRIAVGELLFEPTLAPAIVMDEAIEIAKRYSGEESAVFVNGVLDAVVRRLKGPGAAGAGPEQEGHHEPE